MHRTAKGEDGAKEGAFSVASLPHLRTLALRIQVTNFADEEFLDPLPWVIDLIQTIPPTCPLETIYFQVSFELETIDDGGLGAASWSRLDRILTNRQRFPLLTWVELDLFSFAHTDLPSITKTLIRHIPNVQSLGMLELREAKGTYDYSVGAVNEAQQLSSRCIRDLRAIHQVRIPQPLN